MGTRCETAGKYILPVFKSLVAKELINTHHLTQVEAAQKLGTTQAAISQYVCSKRGTKAASKQCEYVMPKINALAKVAAKRLAKAEGSWKDVSLDFCKRCARCFVDEIGQTGDDYVI